MDTRAHVHALVDQLPPPQLAALETLLQSLVHPAVRTAALAPDDDEPVTEADRIRFEQSQAELANGVKGTPMDEVLAEFGLSTADFPVRP
jgi:hypothetical protein